MAITLTAECVDACFANVGEIEDELGRLLAATIKENLTRQTLSHHTTFSCQPGRTKEDRSTADNPVESLASCGLDKKKCFKNPGERDYSVVVTLRNAYIKHDGICISVSGKGTFKRGCYQKLCIQNFANSVDVGS